MKSLEEYQFFLNENKKGKNISDKEVNELVLRYITEKDANYAILIKGEWGIGKTFLIKNSVISYVKQKSDKHKNVIYISLYGIRDLQELENRMMNSIIESNVHENN